ncbi:MAG: ribonuclease T2 [Pseudolabrys sp.]
MSGIMFRHLLRSAARAVAIAVFAISFIGLGPIAAGPAAAQDAARGTQTNAPGRFDFYVLALSWSPSFCAKQAPARRAREPQCSGRPYAFVVHGLWPQFEHGYPSYCQVPAPRLDRALVDKALALMPSRPLIYHEWNRHGTCSGLSPQAYFAAIRRARAAATVPPAYRDLEQPIRVAPAAVAQAFIKANPGLTRDDMAIGCDRKRLTEVRLCLTRDFKFHACPQIVRRTCRRGSVSMPAVRGGRGSQ